MKKTAVIVAGGSGQRMGSDIPKQFLLLNDKPVLWYTLDTFLSSFDDIRIILVLPEQHMERGKEICSMFPSAGIETAAGGDTRFASVKNGLALIKESCVVFVHDAVRCLVSKALIRDCYEQALEKGSAIPAVAATDSIRIVSGELHTVTDRDHVKIIQTPQTFRSEILLPAFEQPNQDGFTDEATVVEASGRKVYLTDGEYDNIKITRPTDLLIAEKILESRNAG